MANQPNPIATVPGNASGSLAAGVASIVVGYLAKAGYIAAIAGAVGLPEASIIALIGGLIVAGVSYGVTHIAAIKSVNELYSAVPHTYAEYPNDPKPPASQGPSNSNINKGGDGDNG